MRHIKHEYKTHLCQVWMRHFTYECTTHSCSINTRLICVTYEWGISRMNTRLICVTYDWGMSHMNARLIGVRLHMRHKCVHSCHVAYSCSVALRRIYMCCVPPPCTQQQPMTQHDWHDEMTQSYTCHDSSIAHTYTTTAAHDSIWLSHVRHACSVTPYMAHLYT